MNEVIHISIWALVGAAGMVVVAAIVSRILRLRLEKDLLVATLRAFVQLMVVGYILDWIFDVTGGSSFRRG